MKLYRDLDLWQEGRLTEAELKERHPTREVNDLANVHRRLGALAEIPVPDPDQGWQSLQVRLEDRPLGFIQRLSLWMRRPAIGLVTASILGTGTAYAADVRPVRQAVEWLGNGFGGLFLDGKGVSEDQVRESEGPRDAEHGRDGQPRNAGTTSDQNDDGDDREREAGAGDREGDSGRERNGDDGGGHQGDRDEQDDRRSPGDRAGDKPDKRDEQDDRRSPEDRVGDKRDKPDEPDFDGSDEDGPDERYDDEAASPEEDLEGSERD
jgi:hypothetical protein